METPSGEDTDRLCRFCYESYSTPDNSLISPCKCIGSVQYVHQQCIKRWRRATNNPEAVLKCQLCLTTLIMPMRYVLEDIPHIEMDNAWFFLSKPYIFIISLYCFFLYLWSAYPLERIIHVLPLEQGNAIVPYTSHSSINVRYLANLFILSLLAVTSMYAMFYVYLLWTLRNVSLYFQYWRCFKVGNVYPIPYLYMLGTSYLMIYLYVMDVPNTIQHVPYTNKYMTIQTYNALNFVFGELSIMTYFILLPKFIPIHLEILHVINEAAEY